MGLGGPAQRQLSETHSMPVVREVLRPQPSPDRLCILYKIRYISRLQYLYFIQLEVKRRNRADQSATRIIAEESLNLSGGGCIAFSYISFGGTPHDNPRGERVPNLRTQKPGAKGRKFQSLGPDTCCQEQNWRLIVGGGSSRHRAQ